MSIKVISAHPVFNENALVLSKKFDWALESEFDPQPKDLYIVFGGHEIAHQLLEIQYRNKSNFGYVIMNSEQIHSQFFKNKYYLSLMKRNIVFDYNTLTSAYLKENHDIKVLSYFYFEFMKFQDVEKERIYDVAFIGSKNPQRETIINHFKETNPQLNFYVDFDWTHKTPQSMTDILHQCKCVLNIPYYKENPLETHRIHKALACGCDVVSLKCSDEDANEFYKDYIHFVDHLDELPVLTEKKKYEELVKTLSQKFNPHLHFVITQVHQKLLTL